MANAQLDSFRAAYDPAAFRQLGHQAVDLLADHLAGIQRREGPVLPWREPQDALADWPADFSAQGGADPFALIRTVLEGSHHLQHPRYMGHQCSVPLPVTALLGPRQCGKQQTGQNSDDGNHDQ